MRTLAKLFMKPAQTLPVWSGNYMQSRLISLETTQNSVCEGEVKKMSKQLPSKTISTKKKKSGSSASELLNYVKSQPYFASSPTSQALLTKTKHLKVKRNLSESLYLVNEEVGSTMASLAEPYLTDKSATVIEFNPGFGLLTKPLKDKLGFDNINVFEDNEDLAKNLKSAFGKDINVIETNFMTLPRLHHLDKLDAGNRVLITLNSVKSKQNDNLYVFGATPTIDFINFTVKSLVTQRILFDEEINDWNTSNISYFLALGSRPFATLCSTSELGFAVYRAPSVLFQVLFSYISLGTVPRKAFIPWEAEGPAPAINKEAPTDDSEKKRKKRRQAVPYDPDFMNVIKFSLNEQNIAKIGKSNLFSFWYFVRHHLFARRNCVIPELEKWIPGCGPRLIRKGYTIFTKFGSLTPQQILDLYLDFTSWPEFQSSSFLNAMEKYQHKMDSQEDILDSKY